MTKAQKLERQDAIDQLREWIKPGDTVYTVLEHVSRSGMQREIRAVLLSCDGGRVTDLHPNYAIGKALGLRQGKRDGLILGGCGMDMGFHLVYELSYTLYGQGYACLGEGKCPSNYHSNHHDTIRCPGTVVYNPDGPNSGEPCHWSREAGLWVIGYGTDGTDTTDGQSCPTCKGKGRIPNPDGPERFDLTHTDGYALRQRWL